ncbi:MAG: serine/threonine protein kinase [Myxococcales bacterium]|nr:serine/threonine protein kinase [Myxococcales bacterium]
MAETDPQDRTAVLPVDPLVGTTLDRRFLVEFRLAAGGFGAIYRVRHITSGHEFALKVLHPRLTADAGVVARFRREGATLIALRSPHTITAYELGESDDGTLYIVMELLRGVSLFERFRAQGPIEWKRMVAIARAVCDSLAEAHALGIVHRDLKPTNIHLEPHEGSDDFVKVLDFGIAKILKGGALDNADLTNAGQMIGTLDYMPPEQMVGGSCTGASDLYTLGIVMYEMISGRLPYAEASSAGSALAAMLKPPPPLSSRTFVPPELERIVMRCLERKIELRYASAEELASALDGLLAHPEDAASTLALQINPGDDEATAIAPLGLIASLTGSPTFERAPKLDDTGSTPPVDTLRMQRPPVTPVDTLRMQRPPVTPVEDTLRMQRLPAPPADAVRMQRLPTPPADAVRMQRPAISPPVNASRMQRPPASPSVDASRMQRPVSSPAVFGPASSNTPKWEPPPPEVVVPSQTLRGIGTQPPATVPSYDVTQHARPDPRIARVVWAVVLVLAAVIGVALAIRI